MLDWDQATMMPDGGAEARAEQVAALDVVCHGMLADPATGDLLSGAEDAAGDLDPWQQANLAEMRRLWVHATALEPRLVEALAKTVGRCRDPLAPGAAGGGFRAGEAGPGRSAWPWCARPRRPRPPSWACGPYEALIDEYEPGLTRGRDRPGLRRAGLLPAGAAGRRDRAPGPAPGADAAGGSLRAGGPEDPGAQADADPGLRSSTMAGSTPPTIPSAAGCRRMCGSPPATARANSSRG